MRNGKLFEQPTIPGRQAKTSTDAGDQSLSSKIQKTVMQGMGKNCALPSQAVLCLP